MEHTKKEHTDQTVEKLEAFQEQQEAMAKIMKMGFAKYAETLPNLDSAFDLEEHKPAEGLHRCLCCMDGRTPFGVHAAGSTILLSEAQRDEYFRLANPDSISSHDGCGAARLYCKKHGILGDPDAFARQWAEQEAIKRGIPHIHLGVDKDFHYERVCYYDGTGRFNYKGVEGLPSGFVVSRKYMSKESSLAEDGVARNIIFGDHGYGKQLLTSGNPFIFVVVADTKIRMEELRKELDALVASFDDDIPADSVVVDGFVAPKTVR